MPYTDLTLFWMGKSKHLAYRSQKIFLTKALGLV